MSGPQKAAYEKVCSDIANLRSTGNDTVCLLEALLTPAKGTKATKPVNERPTIKSAPKRPAVTTRPTRSGPKTKDAPTFDLHDDLAINFDILAPKQRQKLATLVFNAALKHLSEAAKARHAQKQNGVPDPSVITNKTSDDSSTNRSLKDQCAQEYGGTGKSKSNIVASSKCASLALDCLRALAEADHDPDFVDDALENGGLVILDKCIALELREPADYQSRRLHDQYWKRRKARKPSRTLYERLLLSHTASPASHNFATTLQSQLLRLLILNGVSAITPGFSAALDPATEGSPAWISLQGHRDGFINSATCGAQLRTLSLAMSKLHAIIEQAIPADIHSEALRLAFIALQIKAMSWKHLGHEPDFPRELWSPLSRVVKKALGSTKAKHALRTKALKCLESMQSVLSELGYETAPPATLQSYCGDSNVLVAHKSGPPSTEHKGQHDVLTQLLHDSNIVLSKWETDRVASISASIRCTEALKEAVDHSLVAGSLLVNIARLRKCAATVMDELLQKKLKLPTLCMKDEELGISVLRLLFAVVQFYTRFATSTEAQSFIPNSREESGMLLAYAKAMESLISLDTSPYANGDSIDDGMQDSLRDCATLAKASRLKLSTAELSDGVRDFLDGAPVRISNILWKRYLRQVEGGRPSSVRISALTQSIDVMDGCSFGQRKTAFLGLKYERLARLHLEEEKFSKAQAALELAFRIYIEQAIFDTNCGQMDEAQQCEVLNASLASDGVDQCFKSYLQLSVDRNIPNSRGRWYYDESEQPDLVRAILLERQTLLVLQHCVRAKDVQLSGVIQLWEQLCSSQKCLTYRLSCLSKILNSVAKHNDLDAAMLLGSLATIQRVASYTVNGSESSHAPTLEHFVVAVQWSLATSRVDEVSLVRYASTMPSVLAQLEHVGSALSMDTNVLANVVKIVADLAGMFGLSQTQLEMTERLLVLRDASGDSNKTSMLKLDVARLQIELNHTVSAGKILAKMKTDSMPSTSLALERALCDMEYYLAIGNLEQAKQTIHAILDRANGPRESMTAQRKLEWELQLCRAAMLASRLCQQIGRLSTSTTFARQAVKISSSIWASIEPKLKTTEDSVSNGNESSLQSLVQDMSNLTMSEIVDQRAFAVNDGSRYWRLISVHRSALRRASEISTHNGLYQEAVWFAQQASRLTAWTGSLALRESVNSDMALIYAYAAEHKKAAQFLKPTISNLDDSPDSCRKVLNYAEALAQMGRSDDARKYLQTVREQICRQAPDSPVAGTSIPTTLSSVKTTNITRKRVRKPVAHSKAKSLDTVAPPKMEIMCRRTITARLRIIEQSLPYDQNPQNVDTEAALGVSDLTPTELLSQALICIRKAFQQFATDPSNNTICETALALPVRHRHARKSGQRSLLLEQSPKKTSSSLGDAPNGSELLMCAYTCLRSINANSIPLLSSAKVALLHKALSQVMLVSTAANKPLNHSPLNVVLQSLRPKDVAMMRERYAIVAEHESATLEDVHRWPVIDDVTDTDEDLAEVVRELPRSWTVVSIGLSHDAKELLLSRIVSESSPFLMRVPLARPGPDDDEPCEFTLEYAKQELREIIYKANASCHDSRGQGDKEARKAWYNERERLDKRLESLLANIENIWFGGFRGLLSPANTDGALLARFGESLSQALDKHLPSRQKRSKSQKVDLHAHVLELFTSITFKEGDVDFEDSITDLLYFVVDILQFNGEPNAFDEIDFDTLLLDTTDALRGYHTANTSTAIRHTILIIDKELQAFPWESLPCLRGHPVTRMPSLGAIHDRLKAIPPTTSSYPIPSSSPGGYILNPSSDLVNTQSTFEPLLAQLHLHFSSLINRAPTEPEFRSLLINNSILLYFGHGAGTQYIRNRTIRSLPNCAVTWLMGCSSAKLTEAGIYESYGTPNSYMHAGSPALVGTLWDVTDRDIDRFAVKALSDWGLLDISDVHEKFWGPGARKGKKVGGGGGGGGDDDGSSAKGKGKAKAKAKAPATGGDGNIEELSGVGPKKKAAAVPLDRAVAKARDVCNLKYLNGAAPVVYGVPVSLV